MCSVSGMLAYASTYDGGLSDFFTNTAKDYSLLTGLLAGFVVSTVVTVAVSLWDKRSRSADLLNKDFPTDISETEGDRIIKENLEILEVEWLKTMSIDNPLNPYRSIYKQELKSINAGRILTIHHMETIFRHTRLVSIVGVVISFAVFLIVVPSFALTQEILTEVQLGTWISVCQHWCLVATVFVVIIPPIQEGIQIWREYKKNKSLIDENTEDIEVNVNILSNNCKL